MSHVWPYTGHLGMYVSRLALHGTLVCHSSVLTLPSVIVVYFFTRPVYPSNIHSHVRCLVFYTIIRKRTDKRRMEELRDEVGVKGVGSTKNGGAEGGSWCERSGIDEEWRS